MTHLVIISAPIGPVLRRFADPLAFCDYIARFHRDGACAHWPKSWVSPYELRVSLP